MSRFIVSAILSIGVVLMAVPECACSQQRIQIGLVAPTTPKDSPDLFKAFYEEKAILEKALSLFPHQQSWTWVIYPDEATWRAFTHHINIDGDGPTRSYYGQTDQEAHVTYLRGWTLAHPNDERALPMHVIAHELAYPYLKTRSLRAADDLSVEWVRKYTNETPRSALSMP
jgi:LPS sulfotransferase NodH